MVKTRDSWPCQLNKWYCLKEVPAVITISKPVKMVAVFTPGEAPRPSKFKVKDNRGEEHIVYVDEIIKVFEAITNIRYYCATHYEDFVKRYELIYWTKEYKWEVYRIVL